MLGFFRPVPDAPAVPAERVAGLARRWRLTVFVSITLGYTIFYLTRMSTGVSKDAMIASHTLTIGQAGLIDTVALWTYAVGKTLNGFLADRVSVRRLFATALVVSAAANLAFGLSSWFPLFVGLWAVNGWVQSVGVPASGVVMASWFAPKELGTRYSIWSMAHHLGEGLTFLFTARLIGAATAAGAGDDAWRAAFLGPALIGGLAALVLYRTIVDRPAAIGLPPVERTRKDSQAEPAIGALQREVLSNPWILLCGLASGLVYVSRSALNGWGVLYLQHACGYSVGDAGEVLSVFPIAGIAGTLLAGPTSDRLAGGRRVPVAAAYGVIFCVALAVFYSTTDGVWLRVSLAASGFAMGGLLVFLGGLLAIELCSKRAAGAALGVIGGLSYLCAGLQSLASSYLIDAASTKSGADVTTYDFSDAKWLWIGAPCLAVVLTLALWKAERRAGVN